MFAFKEILSCRIVWNKLEEDKGTYYGKILLNFKELR